MLPSVQIAMATERLCVNFAFFPSKIVRLCSNWAGIYYFRRALNEEDHVNSDSLMLLFLTCSLRNEAVNQGIF